MKPGVTAAAGLIVVGGIILLSVWLNDSVRYCVDRGVILEIHSTRFPPHGQDERRILRDGHDVVSRDIASTFFVSPDGNLVLYTVRRPSSPFYEYQIYDRANRRIVSMPASLPHLMSLTGNTHVEWSEDVATVEYETGTDVRLDLKTGSSDVSKLSEADANYLEYLRTTDERLRQQMYGAVTDGNQGAGVVPIGVDTDACTNTSERIRR